MRSTQTTGSNSKTCPPVPKGRGEAKQSVIEGMEKATSSIRGGARALRGGKGEWKQPKTKRLHKRQRPRMRGSRDRARNRHLVRSEGESGKMTRSQEGGGHD